MLPQNVSPLNNQIILFTQHKSKTKQKLQFTMEKHSVILISFFCFLSLFGSAYSNERFYIEGKVYCDTCRLQFITKLSEFLEGATVRVECKEQEGGSVTFSKEAVTDSSGIYKLEVDGDHEDELCAVKLVKSPRSDCSEVDSELHLDQSARISITNNNGIVSPYRQANPLGFLKKERLPDCAKILKELGIREDGTPKND
ncbi:olee1-like protein [Arachis ipaensis]|uniref:Olee1-like protein n=2 Tax=Arachis hypogaea TaxID=3818 RepID=A0A444WYV3_ARAHY|nr:olee1-like protein [Arachis ipaensis]XP_025685799.1 olee1-like protein [Arachis hypogaea]RYQ82591.1 hypothetical protein Ahy_B10g101173 [Arachis hypogaea]